MATITFRGTLSVISVRVNPPLLAISSIRNKLLFALTATLFLNTKSEDYLRNQEISTRITMTVKMIC